MEIQFLDKHLEDFVHSLERATFNRVIRMIDYLEKMGHQIRMPHAKKISHNLFELRIKGAEQVRIFFAYHHHKIFLLHGFTKKTQQIPLAELRLAEQKLRSLH